MKIIKRQRVKVIEATCGEDYENQFESIMSEVETFNPKVVDTSSPLTCKIYFEEVKEIPETYEDEATLKGLRTVCELCPYFEKSHKQNQKKGNCSKDIREWTRGDWCACEQYYELLIKGKLGE